MTRPGVTVLVQVHDELDALTAWLEAVRATTRPDDQIIVVDRSSTDGSALTLAGHADRVRWVRVPRDWDAQTARRVAIDGVKTPVVVLVDVDTMPVAPWLDRLVAPLTDPTIGVVGPMTLIGPATQRIHLDSPMAPSADGVRRVAQRAMRRSGAVRDVAALDGFAVATRTELLGPGWSGDPADVVDLVRASGTRTVVATDAFLFRLLPEGEPPEQIRPEVSLVIAVGGDLGETLDRLSVAADEVGDQDVEVVLIDQGAEPAELVATALSGATVRILHGSGGADDLRVAARLAAGFDVVTVR